MGALAFRIFRQRPFVYLDTMPGDFYTSRKWKSLRARFVAKNRHAGCQLCGNDFGQDERIDVDHIVPRRIAPHREYDWTNLRCLCVSCHSMRTNNRPPRKTIGLDGFPIDSEWTR